MKVRVAAVAALAVSTLAVAPLAAQAAPAGQYYTHLVQGHSWSSGGTYIAKGGDVKLNLTTVPKATEVLVEECESGGDLGDVQVFTKKSPSHVLATDVPAGQCFLILFESKAKSDPYLVTGKLSF
ncbi:hypothetical protein [Kribbella sp. NPDC006257]|jgi:hypothetical protein|uniref:hypothetical protein n=1 Tax=Kribbella sp. NPDC006257 TaxID=3156738 RepID=UPI0033B40C43